MIKNNDHLSVFNGHKLGNQRVVVVHRFDYNYKKFKINKNFHGLKFLIHPVTAE
jgi:hypothetical protein